MRRGVLRVRCVGVFLSWFLAAWIISAGAAALAGEPSSGKESPAGNPSAEDLVPFVVQEVRSGLKTRNIEDNFARFRSYLGLKLDSTAGNAQTSEVTGNCRLSWYDHLLRNPLDATAEAEKFTRELHQALRGNHQGLARALAIAREKMDCGRFEPQATRSPATPDEALDTVKQALVQAQAGYAAALAPLSRAEIGNLASNLVRIFASQNGNGHTLDDRGNGRRLCDLMERMDRGGFHSAAEALVPLVNPEFLKQLAKLPDAGSVQVEGVSGTVVREILTPAGRIIIGGKEKNIYDLDKMMDVAAVIDLGGDDVYREGSVNFQRPVLVVIDLGNGKDRYEGTKPGIQGGAVMGVSLLIDEGGDDVYQARDVAQGSALCGVGMLVDFAGDDRYVGLRRVQGQALAGLGLLLDRAGIDSYHAALWAQGFGAPLGFGVLEDLDGADHYYCGGLYPDSYPETPGYDGWGQGVGAGIRQVADGGIGVILDGGGDDVYEYDYMGHGGGYWLGLGFARDFGGNDRRLAGTQKEYGGGPRRETQFQRFGCGFGCHYALGFCFDDGGDDTYGGTIMGVGFGWDASVGVLCDFGGNDRYEGTGGSTEGNGAQASLGILFDYTGNDVYVGSSQGYANPSISYHALPQCGGNFSFVIDYGGKDYYGCGAQDNTYNQRGAAGGFLIDRPLKEEAAPEADKKQSVAGTSAKK